MTTTKIAIIAREAHDDSDETIYKVFETLNRYRVEIFVHDDYLKHIAEKGGFMPKYTASFNSCNQMPEGLQLLISVGGDGTMLKSVPYAVRADIPVLGINSGRLGFLASVSQKQLDASFDDVFNGNFSVEQRSLIEVSSEVNRFGDINFALNEFAIMRVNSSSMISINAYVNDEFLNTYWADGLIVATPTGSTAYSLSAGGPIITPGSGNFVITPVSPHNLSVRPIVISDTSVLKLKAEGREQNLLASLDYRQVIFPLKDEFTVKKSDKQLKLIKLSNSSFFTTLRNKLLWGMDKRNR